MEDNRAKSPLRVAPEEVAYAYKAMIPLTAKNETIAQTRCLPGKMLIGVEALSLWIFWHTPGPIP